MRIERADLGEIGVVPSFSEGGILRQMNVSRVLLKSDAVVALSFMISW